MEVPLGSPGRRVLAELQKPRVAPAARPRGAAPRFLPPGQRTRLPRNTFASLPIGWRLFPGAPNWLRRALPALCPRTSKAAAAAVVAALELEWALLGAAPAVLRPRPLLVLGPAGSGRSALLFRAALVAAASAPPARVLFLAPRPLERLPPGGAAATGAIQRIHFLYPPSFQALLHLVASLHQTFSSAPSLVILDGLEEYLGGCPSPHMAAQLVALLLDTANHFRQKLSHLPLGCQLLVAMKYLGEDTEEAEYLSVTQRYFPAQLWLHSGVEEAVGSKSCGVTKLVRACLSQPRMKDQEWLLQFDPQGDMKISTLPLSPEKESGAASEKEGLPRARAHSTVADSQTEKSGIS